MLKQTRPLTSHSERVGKRKTRTHALVPVGVGERNLLAKRLDWIFIPGVSFGGCL